MHGVSSRQAAVPPTLFTCGTDRKGLSQSFHQCTLYHGNYLQLAHCRGMCVQHAHRGMLSVLQPQRHASTRTPCINPHATYERSTTPSPNAWQARAFEEGLAALAKQALQNDPEAAAQLRR